jgi:hypothetical protein
VGSVVDEVALRQFLSKYSGFLCRQFHRLLNTHKHPSSGPGTIGEIMADVPSGPNLTPPQGKSRDQQQYLVSTAAALLPLISLGFYFLFGGAVEMSPLLLRQFTGLLYQPWMMVMDDERGEMGGMLEMVNLSIRGNFIFVGCILLRYLYILYKHNIKLYIYIYVCGPQTQLTTSLFIFRKKTFYMYFMCILCKKLYILSFLNIV